jgi:Ca2+:H+ antiporter
VLRSLYRASLALTPVVLVARFAFGDKGAVVFALAALALMPLAFLIGEATENVAEHTGPGVGGFLNASFGNAPELIIALFAINDSLPNVVRGSITGSIVSTALLVLGGAMILAEPDEIDRRSVLVQISTVGLAVVLFLVPSVPGWHGIPDRHSLYLATLPVAAVLLVVYLLVTARNLRTHSASAREPAGEGAWPLRKGIIVLGAATVATALVSEALVDSLEAFGRSLGLSQFVVSTVIVALVGNAAEHGGAIVVARRGNIRLGAEIAISSATQVAAFVAPIVALASGIVGRGLPLAFRPVEIGTMAVGVAVVFLVALDGRLRRWEGVVLLGVYVLVVVAFVLSGDR